MMQMKMYVITVMHLVYVVQMMKQPIAWLVIQHNIVIYPILSVFVMRAITMYKVSKYVNCVIIHV